MTGFNRRDVERAIEQAENGDSDGLEAVDDREAKGYAGRVDVGAFTLPEEAAEMVAAATEPDHPAPVVAYEDAEDAADALADIDPGDAVGFDPETVFDADEGGDGGE